MGEPDWTKDARFATAAGRLEHQDELDEGIEQWTRTLDKYTVAERCQAAEVRAMPVQSSADRVESDPQLRHRELYKVLDHPELGPHAVQQAPFKLSATPAHIHSAGPLIGAHTREVLEDLLDFDLETIREGFGDGTFWPATRARFGYLDEMLQ